MAGNSCFVVVTGSTSGIGQAIAVRLAERGLNVIIHGHSNHIGAARTAEQVREFGSKAEVIMADISSEEDRQRLVRMAFSLGPIQAWVHNAGADVLTGKSAALSFEEKLDRLWAVDVRGTILLARLVAYRMLEQQRNLAALDDAGIREQRTASPAMLFIGWDQAESGMEGDAGQMFGPIKSAVTSFSKSLAQELAPVIRVNCVAPGWIRTAWGEATDEYWNRRACTSSLMNRWGSPADIASAVGYLISDEAEFICGQVLEVNGGWNRRYDRP